MKEIITKVCVWLLNGPLRTTPCEYKLVNNLEVFGEDFLRNEVRLDPTKTIQKFLYETMRMKQCMESREKNGGICVLEGDEMREATEKDIEELKNLAP